MKFRQRLGLCWGCVPGGTLMDVAWTAAENGFAFITITPGHYLAQREAGLSDAQIRAGIADLGIAVSVIDPLIGALPGTPDPAAVDPAMRHFFTYTEDQCRSAAEATGAATINLAHFLGVPVDLPELQDAVAGIAERNHTAGFKTALEFIPGTGVPNLAAALEIVSVTPHASVMFDSWHFARSDGTLGQLAALPPRAIGAAQISDQIHPAPATAYVPMTGRLLPGEGELPLAQMLALIERVSPGLDVGLEVFSDELKAMGWDIAGARLAKSGRDVLAAAEREFIS